MGAEIGQLETENLGLLGTLDEVQERNELANEKGEKSINCQNIILLTVRALNCIVLVNTSMAL